MILLTGKHGQWNKTPMNLERSSNMSMTGFPMMIDALDVGNRYLTFHALTVTNAMPVACAIRRPAINGFISARQEKRIKMDNFKLYDTVLYQGQEVDITDERGEGETQEYRIAFNHQTYTHWEWVKPDTLTKVPTEIERLQAENAALKAKLESIHAAHVEAQSVMSVLNADPTVAMFQIAAHFQTMGNKVGRILQDEAEKIDQRDAWFMNFSNGEADCSQCGKHDYVCVCAGHCYDCCKCTPDDLPA